MSSFLMNTGPSYHHQPSLHHQSVVVDPKFPPTEEYSQNNYINADFFNGHHHHHGQYGGYHHQATGTPYGVHGSHGGVATNYGSYAAGNYYHQLHPPELHHHHLPPEAQQPPSLLQPPPQCLPPSSTVLDSPKGSSSPCHLKSPDISHQDLQVHIEDDIVSDEQEEGDEDDLLTNGDGSPLTIDESSESGDRIIYPWMKKIHVAGVGKWSSINIVISVEYFKLYLLFFSLAGKLQLYELVKVQLTL